LLPLVTHERRGVWARQLGPQAAHAGWPVRLVESRSRGDAVRGVAGRTCPLALIDLGERPVAGLDVLDAVMQAAPAALVLVLDPSADAAIDRLARELGAAQVLSRPRPPEVVALLDRWVALARTRCEASGWSSAEREPLDPIDALIAGGMASLAAPPAS
jgi:CheY-like chemotaxis protein